jgi:hypothetical protein
MIRIFVSAVLGLAVALLCMSCSGSTGSASKQRLAAPDPQWVSAISQHSNGAISRHSPIRVLFTHDVVAPERVGTDASANITIVPAVKMHASFASRREIVLRAETQFAPGTEYRVGVNSAGLTGVPADAKPFEFLVKTLGVAFDVKPYGLEVQHDRNELMVLRGAILTSDTEDRERIEKILTATLDGKPLPIVWTAGEHEHAFSVIDIVRKSEEQEVVLRWDGGPLGVENTGSKEWRIPVLDEFAVTQTEAVQVNDQRQIQVRFSDSLDARQDLKGQIRLSTGEFTTSISGNLITLYLNEAAVGEVTLTLEPAIRSRAGVRLAGTREFKLEFANTKPQVRFVGKGVILPDAATLRVPFEAVSARAVRVTALEVFEPNIRNSCRSMRSAVHRNLAVSAECCGARRSRSPPRFPANGRATTSMSLNSCVNTRADCSSSRCRLAPPTHSTTALTTPKRPRPRRSLPARRTVTVTSTRIGTITVSSTTPATSTGTNATIPARRRTTVTGPIPAPSAISSHRTSG